MAESVETIPNLVVRAQAKTVNRITSREWMIHGSLFILTLVTTTVAGIILVAPDLNVPEPPLTGFLNYLLYVPRTYLWNIGSLLEFAFFHRQILAEGVTFSLALLAILFAHEMGHYLACRRYGVGATLPFFIPAPPLFLAGTFGAFIKIRTPIPSRRALFDIGLAGPIAGFVIALPVAVIGVLHNQPPIVATGSEIVFNDPLLMRLLAKALGIDLDPYSPINPYYMAAWIGLLVTSLNLMPVGQLDGGHGVFAVFGARAHRLVGRLAFVSIAVLAVLGLLWHGSPSGFLFVVLLGIMQRVGHPQPVQMEPLGKQRIVVAILTLLIFCLSFYPFPFTLN
ncbi:MAG TPA: site-2 protease family protein [Pyrinomonadaceae bacterium]|nr:site-2 protease family protein [Pyrinomonadaceae bacterium]